MYALVRCLVLGKAVRRVGIRQGKASGLAGWPGGGQHEKDKDWKNSYTERVPRDHVSKRTDNPFLAGGDEKARDLLREN